jgi:hypothetical protein
MNPLGARVDASSTASISLAQGRPTRSSAQSSGPALPLASRCSDAIVSAFQVERAKVGPEIGSRESGQSRQHEWMLLYLTGSSCSGKTTLASAAARKFPGLAVHDVDEPGATRDAPSEYWIRRTLEYQRCGSDMLLAGQAPLGEILAAPSAPLLDGIALCLVDVADDVRRERLALRQPGKWDTEVVDAFLGWAAWHRGHAADPRYRPEVLLAGSRTGTAWHRWTAWDSQDPRWATHVLDTTDEPVDRSIQRVEAWITEQRDALRAGNLALRHGWDRDAPTRRSGPP